jgi:hypothetical protein
MKSYYTNAYLIYGMSQRMSMVFSDLPLAAERL